MPNLPTESPPFRRSGIYGAFAFGSVIVTCFLQFSLVRRFDATVGQVALTFALGAVFATLGVLQSSIIRACGGKNTWALYLVMTAVVTTLLFVSPLRGFFAIIVLPMVSMAIFEFRRSVALVACLYYYALCIAVLWWFYGVGAIADAMMSYVAAFAFTTVFTIITKQALDARARAEKLRQELEDANTQLRVYAAQAEEHATTRERNRVAREIHDGLGHYLTVVKTQLDAAAALLPADPARARETIDKAAKLTAEALDDVRRSVGSLRTETRRPPLPESLRELAAHGLPVPTLAIEGAPRALPPGIEHALFRAAQEGLTNIRKHARATQASVSLDFRPPARVVLELLDDGVGAPAVEAKGFGLQGLRERIEVIGGTVSAANRPTGGFALRVEVPA